jgi:type II secretory pathway pseudopilin PulG
VIVKRVAAEIRGAHAAREARALPGARAFTVIELLIVMGIILVLAGLILATSSYVQKKGQRARAEAEIAAISAAVENYKADNGIYPQGVATNSLDPTSDLDPSAPPSGQTNKYSKAGLYLFEQLFGVTSGNRSEIPSAKSYFTFKPNMLYPPSTGDIVAIRDPFGNLYGYSTMKASNPANNGYNPTFDLWSTAGLGTPAGSTATPTPSPLPTPQNQWIKNW